MKPFSNNRTKRNTAFVALLVWLFALASGVANACVLEVPGTHSHSHVATNKASENSLAHAAGAQVGHAVAVDDDDDDGDDDLGASKDSCLKVCDDGSSSLVKLQTGLDLNDPGLAPLVAIAWNAATPIVSAPCQFNELRVPILGPPLRVRYSRLTL